MEVIKEGTYTYLLKQIEYRTPVYDESVVHTQNESWDYYLSVEYEILKRNELKTLVSAQLREKDEEKSLLFDITGKRPLKRQGKERAFSQKECEKILQNMRNMIQEIEDYMLDLNCIELRPEYIYEEKGGNEQVLQEYTELPVIYIYASQHRILDNALNLMNCKKDIYQIDLDKIKQNIKKVDASEDEMIIYVDTLVNDYGSSVDECLKYVKQELNYNKSELLGTDDMSNIYLLKR